MYLPALSAAYKLSILRYLVNLIEVVFFSY